MDKNKSIVTFGEIILRLSPPGYLKMQQSRSFEFYFGGTELNVAASLSKFGLPVRHISAVSNDFVGDAALSTVMGYGVDTSFIQKVDHPLGLYFLEQGSGSRASRIAYNRLFGAFSHVVPEHVDWDAALRNSDFLHWTGISPGISEGAYQTLLQGLKTANDKGVLVSADPAYRSNLWQYGRKGPEVLSELVALSNIFIGGVNEINEIMASDFPQNEDGFIAASKQLKGQYGNIRKVFDKVRTGVSATHQRIYSQAWDGATYYKTEEIEIAHAVDRIGTGDAFAAGLLYGLRNYNDEAALRFANAACVLKHTVQGDINLCSVDEIMELIQGGSGGRIKR